MSPDTIRFSRSGHIARITLDNPARHNALGGAEIARLRELCEQIDADPGLRVLLLTGNGEKTFCAGAALDEFSSGDMSGELFTTLTDRLAALRVPSVCALNGNVFGGGAETALCCDYRIGVRGMRLRVPAARIGLCYPLSGLRRYVDKLGLSAAKRILVAAEELDCDTLLAIGFLHRAVEREALEAEALAFAGHLAGLAPLAVQSMKYLLGAIAEGTLDEAEAARHLARCAQSADVREGLAAQRERRAPAFTGA